jgi:hypothetical protein
LYHSTKFDPVELTPGLAEHVKNLLPVLADKYPKVEGRSYEQLISPVDFWVESNGIKHDGSPGYPWMVTAKENRDVPMHLLYKAVCTRLETYKRMWKEGVKPRELGPGFDPVRAGVADPVRLFIKQEPHSSAKMREGRYRLIASVGLTDQMIQRLMYGPQNRKEIENWDKIPSMPGLSCDMKDDRMNSWLQKLPEKLDATDLSTFDWSVQEWSTWNESDRRRICNNWNENSLEAFINDIVHYTELNTTFVTSSGDMYRTLKLGHRNSGAYITSSGNSAMRVALAQVIGCTRAWAMGDDDIETKIHPDPETNAKLKRMMYKKLGYSLKFCTTHENFLDFCSHKIEKQEDRNVMYPDDLRKSLFRLLSNQPSLELFAQFMTEYRTCPDIDRAVEVIELSGWSKAFRESDRRNTTIPNL